MCVVQSPFHSLPFPPPDFTVLLPWLPGPKPQPGLGPDISTLPCLLFFSIHDYTIQLSVLTLMQFQTRSNQTYSFSSLSIVPSTFPSQISLLSTKHQINEPWQPRQPNPRTGSRQVLGIKTTTTQRKPAKQTGQNTFDNRSFLLPFHLDSFFPTALIRLQKFSTNRLDTIMKSFR